MVRTFWIFTLVISLASCGGESSRSSGDSSDSGGSGGTGETGGSGGTSETGGTGTTGGSGGATSTGGNAATGGTAGIAPTCDNGVARTSDDDRAIGVALEASSLASPDRIVSFMVLLVDPGFDFERFQSPNDEEREALIAEREAQLAPTQDAIEERLRALGGEEVSRTWLVNSMDARLPARHMSEVPCWPAVVRIELSENYWDVVEPTWDPSTVGDAACPLEGDACTAHCGEIWGTCIDAVTLCLVPSTLVACSRIENGFTDGFSACSVRVDTGGLCTFGGVVPTEPGYAGWAPCTEEQAQLAFSALPCGTR